MSNLLNKKPKKKLDRGPSIMPEKKFSLNDIEPAKDTEQEIKVEDTTDLQKSILQQNTSVRVSKGTRATLNFFVQLGEADTVDQLIEKLLESRIQALNETEKQWLENCLEKVK